MGNKYYSGVLIFSVCLLITPCLPQKKIEEDAFIWSYEGNKGPSYWASIDSAFSACAKGTKQSPVDITFSDTKIDTAYEDIQIQYEPTTFSLIHDGHTIQANTSSDSNIIRIDEEDYTLSQIHFHSPSEHQLNGQKFEMEGHLVHRNSEDELAVVGFFIREGDENKVLSEMWSKLPVEKTKEEIAVNQPVNLAHLFPEEKSIFHYSGSLTTPPCSEGVEWLVLEQAIEMSKEQIDSFRSILSENNRPIQPLNERAVWESEF